MQHRLGDDLPLGVEEGSLYKLIRVNQDCRANEHIQIMPEEPGPRTYQKHDTRKSTTSSLKPRKEVDTHP